MTSKKDTKRTDHPDGNEWVTDRYIDTRTGTFAGNFQVLTLEFRGKPLRLVVDKQLGLGWCARATNQYGALIMKKTRLGSAQNARGWIYNEIVAWMEKMEKQAAREKTS
jgi:hypothetical protein